MGYIGGGYGDEPDEAIDHKGDPADKSRTGGWLAAGLILGDTHAPYPCVREIERGGLFKLVQLYKSVDGTVVENMRHGNIDEFGDIFGGGFAYLHFQVCNHCHQLYGNSQSPRALQRLLGRCKTRTLSDGCPLRIYCRSGNNKIFIIIIIISA
ncbi:hypothetical protein AMTR_s00112p00148080 [Amborella trichopoda]|uniref:Uncharacterized protein n=1 Tax=Amborella trichopoda TaxID=13333 RepID=W1NXX8_AMBTC|nr:hypothetical protein AMTR_s00112p00148080 [Amborella trichopoda]